MCVLCAKEYYRMCIYVEMLLMVNAMAMDMIYEYQYHVKRWIIDKYMTYVKVLEMTKYKVWMYFKSIDT